MQLQKMMENTVRLRVLVNHSVADSQFTIEHKFTTMHTVPVRIILPKFNSLMSMSSLVLVLENGFTYIFW
jgi:hypothetical protein